MSEVEVKNMTPAIHAAVSRTLPAIGDTAPCREPSRCVANSGTALASFFSMLERHQMIAEAAYFRAEQHAFEPGHELDDWLAAEHDVNAACGLLEPEPRWDLSQSE